MNKVNENLITNHIVHNSPVKDTRCMHILEMSRRLFEQSDSIFHPTDVPHTDFDRRNFDLLKSGLRQFIKYTH